jgi:DNA-binding response OmpR family regulator
VGRRLERGLDTVLVADADAAARGLVADLLARAGYLAVLSEDGDEALEVGRRERPELALLDVSLPGISGYEVCRELKDEFGERFPVILVSGSRTEPYDRAVGLFVGVEE